MNKYIAYYRVSTKKQGSSGLGLDAQKMAVINFIALHPDSEALAEFTEVESGKKSDRKELKEAIKKCKETGSTLIIAKLDRLSRDIVFIFTLRDELHNAGVGFMALDLPEANTLTLGIMASFAQHERERISSRTKDGLVSIKNSIKRDGFAIGKRSGRAFTRLGCPDPLVCLDAAIESSAISRRQKKINDTGFRQTYELARLLFDSGLSNIEIATRLNCSGYKTPKGFDFLPATVSRLLRDGKKLLKNTSM